MKATALYLNFYCANCLVANGNTHMLALNEDTAISVCPECGIDITAAIARSIANPVRLAVNVEVPEGATRRDIQEAGDELVVHYINAVGDTLGLPGVYARKLDEPETVNNAVPINDGTGKMIFADIVGGQQDGTTT